MEISKVWGISDVVRRDEESLRDSGRADADNDDDAGIQG